MTFGITHNHDLFRDVLLNVKARIEGAQRLLKKGAGSRYVHEVRKELKKCRAALRLLRKSLGTHSFQKLDHTLQKAAKRLSPSRDAEALQKIIAGLGRSHRNEIAKALLSRLRATVPLRLKATRLTQAELKQCGKDLSAALQKIKGCNPSKLGWRDLSHRVRQSYLEGNEAFHEAKSAPSFDSLHAWRKLTKTLWNQLRLLRDIEPRELGRLVKKAGKLGDVLGEDHDLGMFVELLPEMELASSEIKGLQRLINEKRRRLQNAAFKSGAALYAGDASSLGRRIHKYGRNWSR